jgi:hypothetical protein
MGTKINPLDLGVVTNQETTITEHNNISMTLEITIVFESEEDFIILGDAIINNIEEFYDAKEKNKRTNK